MKSTFNLTLILEDGASWFAGNFNSKESLDKWIAEEQSRPYWNPNTQLQIDEIAPPLTQS